MPIVQSFATVRRERSAVSLARYCVEILPEYPEWMFWGVFRPNDANYACRSYWLKWERDMIGRYLWEAQTEVERQIGWPIGRRWFTNDQQDYSFPLMAEWGHVVAGGIEARTTIQANAVVTHNADVGGTPTSSTVTVATTVTDVNEIRVYYPASLGVEGPVEIDPSDIDIAGGIATISIPRWRLVHPSFVDNPRTGVDYTVVTNFLSTVDVVRVYHDDSTQATLVWPHRCGASSYCTCSCSDYQQSACIYVLNSDDGSLNVLPATYSGGAWVNTSGRYCSSPTSVLLNYRAGIDENHDKWDQALDTVVRLAHTKMPEEPCGCELARRKWRQDRVIPEVLTRERINNPFGTMDGAWTAFRFATDMKTHRRGLVL